MHMYSQYSLPSSTSGCFINYVKTVDRGNRELFSTGEARMKAFATGSARVKDRHVVCY